DAAALDEAAAAGAGGVAAHQAAGPVHGELEDGAAPLDGAAAAGAGHVAGDIHVGERSQVGHVDEAAGLGAAVAGGRGGAAAEGQVGERRDAGAGGKGTAALRGAAPRPVPGGV